MPQGQGICCQARLLELDAWDPHSRRNEPNPESGPHTPAVSVAPVPPTPTDKMQREEVGPLFSDKVCLLQT